MRRFAKGENKEQIARPLIEAAERDGGDGRVVLIGIAQEKTPMWRSWKPTGHEHAAHPHTERGRQMGFVNHFYVWYSDWGAAFWKTNAYSPWPVWIWLSGTPGRSANVNGSASPTPPHGGPNLGGTRDILEGKFWGADAVRTDGQYYWTESAAEYVEHYGIALPAKLVDVGRKRNWVPPCLDEGALPILESHIVAELPR